MDFAQIIITVPAIAATVEWGKSTFNITGRWSQLTAVIIGIAFAALSLLITSDQLAALQLNDWLAAVVKGFLHGLAAAGFYDLAAGKLKPTATPDPAGVLAQVTSKPKGKHAL